MDFLNAGAALKYRRSKDHHVSDGTNGLMLVQKGRQDGFQNGQFRGV
jgi:hypothetical protein